MKKEPSSLFSFEEYLKEAEAFHGFAAPGLLVGGFMVRKAMKHFPPGVLYEVLCETSKCLPDAIQLLTPCTIGNGRLRIISLGRFALSFFNKDTGSGVRVFPNPAKVESWPELNAWYMKLKTKHEQDLNLLIAQIKQAGEEILEQQSVRVKPEVYRKISRGPMALCPVCGEIYPAATGSSCLACRGESPYVA
ncbi:MAG TPA: formylmethanofuran dehydrogenase subunit E family protein [Thermodesulfobacteriota bacterium]|nr:formylmethanofuran dehydrogenase subunit E family protein [Thermodesulfobacteriota bacterium]